jgi:hypothetical protein
MSIGALENGDENGVIPKARAFSSGTRDLP